MAAADDHPFSIDVRRCPMLANRFVWTIKEGRSLRRRSPDSHPTFEEARIAARTSLNRMVAGWRH